MEPRQLFTLLRQIADNPAYAAWMDEHENMLVHAVYTVQQSIKPHPSHIESAQAYIDEAAAHLASLPPPGPGRLKDDIGLSGSTWGPIQHFVGMTSPEIADYLGAAEYLRVHVNTQLDAERWRDAYDIIKASTPLSATQAQKRLTAAVRKDLARREDPGGRVTAKADGRLMIALEKRVSGSRWAQLGLRGARFDGADLAWVVAPNAVGDAVAALRALKLDVLADDVQDMIDAGTIGVSVVDTAKLPAIELPVVELPAIDETSTSYRDASWKWATDGRIEINGLRISGKIMDNVGLRKRRDYQWVTSPKGDFTLFLVPAAVDTLLADPWISDNFRQVHALRTMQAWARATGTAIATAAEETQHARSSLCDRLGSIWKTASIAEIEDPVARRAVQDITRAIDWPAGLQPFGYQEVGIGYAVLRDGRAYIGDAMGLGKTLQAIGVLKYDIARFTPAVVVCPSGVVFNWRDEIYRFAPELTPVPVTGGKQALPALQPGLVLIMSWDMMKRHHTALLRVQTAIFDEAHYAKNFNAARTKAAVELARTVPHVLLLSGTPFPNRPIELFSQLTMIDPHHNDPIFAGLRAKYRGDSAFVAFGQEYANGERKHIGGGRYAWDFSGASNLQGLRDALACMMVARTKTQPGIAGQLPPKTRTQLWIPLEGGVKTAYRRAEQSVLARACENAKARILPDILVRYHASVDVGTAHTVAVTHTMNWANDALPDYTQGTALVEVGALLRDVGILKIPAAVDWIMTFLESSPDPLVVFVKHKAVLRGISEALEKASVAWTFVDGSVGSEEANERVRAFQDGRHRVIIATEKLREGVNLQNAADMLFVERWWVPGYEEQAEGRVHRRGGRGVPVNIRYLMIEGTIDAHIHRLVDVKRGNFEDVFDREEFEELERTSKVPNIESALIDSMTRDAISGCKFKRSEIDAIIRGME